jgi:hypothetical protein
MPLLKFVVHGLELGLIKLITIIKKSLFLMEVPIYLGQNHHSYKKMHKSAKLNGAEKNH